MEAPRGCQRHQRLGLAALDEVDDRQLGVKQVDLCEHGSQSGVVGAACLEVHFAKVVAQLLQAVNDILGGALAGLVGGGNGYVFRGHDAPSAGWMNTHPLARAIGRPASWG